MTKRILAALLAVTLAFVCFGCGAKETKDNQPVANAIKGDGKIALVVGTAEQEPELAAAAQTLATLYGDALVTINYPEHFAVDDTALASAADKAVQDENVKVVIFAGGVNGTAKAAARVRELREDMAIIVCNPLEGIDSVRLTANLVFSLDFAAFADALVQNAKTMGAENFVFYTTDRSLQLPVIRELRTAVESGCKAQKLTCKAASCVDIYEEGKTVDMAKEYIAEDAERKREKFGEKTALFCTEPTVQGTLAGAAALFKMVVPATFLPSPILPAEFFEIDLTGHETDGAYAFDALQKSAEDNGIHGRVATWSFSEPIVALLAAVDYACAFLSGDAGLMVDADAVDGYVRAHTDAAFTFADSGYSHVFLFDSTAVTV